MDLPDGGESAGGGSGGGSIFEVPAAPTALTATAGNQQIALDWTASGDAFSYRVYMGTDPASLTERTETGLSSANILELSNGVTYYFAVSALSIDDQESPRTDVVSATPRPEPLRVTSLYPANGATVRRDVTIDLEFSENLSPSSVVLTSNPPHQWTLSEGFWENEVEARPIGLLQANTTYEFTVEATLPSGRTLERPYEFFLNTGATPTSVAETPPRVTSTSPRADAGAVPETSFIIVSFSKPMLQPQTEGALSFTPAVGCTWSWNSSGTTLTCQPQSPLQTSTEYQGLISTAARAADDGGMSLDSPFAWRFMTRIPDTTPPTLVSYVPAEATQGEPRFPTVTLTFSEPMDCASVKSAFTWVTPSRTVGTFSKCSGNNAYIEPDSQFAYGETVTWRIGTGAKDLAGNVLTAGAQHTFRIARVATVTLAAQNALDGVVSSGGAVNASATPMKVGYSGAQNTEFRSFASFDLAAIPSTALRISTATLNVTQTASRGDVFSKFGGVYAQRINYGPSLEAADFAKAADTRTSCTLLFFCTQVTDETSLSQSGTIGPRSISVGTMVSRDFNDRSARGNRSQFRLIVGYDKFSDGGTRADGGTDEVDFGTGEAIVGKPSLDVTYEYP